MAKNPTKKPRKPTKQSFAAYLKSNPRERAAFIILISMTVALLVGWAVIAYSRHRNQQSVGYGEATASFGDVKL